MADDLGCCNRESEKAAPSEATAGAMRVARGFRIAPAKRCVVAQ